MGRTTRLFFLLMLGVSLVGCSSGAPSATASRTPAVSPTASTAASAFPTGPVEIGFWWWGETEAPGSQKWLEAAEAAYTKIHPNVTFKNNLLSTDAFLPALDAAAAAKSGPTIEYLWAGTVTLDRVWKDQIVPISDYVGMDEAQHYISHQEPTWDGKVWAAAFYGLPSYPLVYNKATLAKAGVAQFPATFEELLAACDASAAKGIPFIGFGVKDGWGTGRIMQALLGQTSTSLTQLIESAAGETSYSQPAYSDFFNGQKQLVDRRCFPDDVKSLDMYSGQQRVITGKAVSTFITGAEIASYTTQIGADNTGVSVPPAFGSGPFRGKMGMTAPDLAITKWSSDDQKTVAADFIKFMHTPDQLTAYYAVTGVPPADDRFNFDSITVPQVAQIYTAGLQTSGPVVENYIPTDVIVNGIGFAQAQLITGDVTTADQAIAITEQAAKKWRDSNRLLVDIYKQWGQQQSQ